MKLQLRYASIALLLGATSVYAGTRWTTGAYQNNEHIEKKLSIPHAEELIVTISGKTEKYYDFIIIKNKKNETIKKLSGNMNNSFNVSGDSITAILDSDYSITERGVTVTVKNVEPVNDNDDEENTGKALTREELRKLIIAYGDDPTTSNKRAIEKANTSQITDMHNIFDVSSSCDSGYLFDGDISRWDTSNVTNMEKMFMGSDITILPESFSTEKVTNMKNMFYRSKINMLPDNFHIAQDTKVDSIFAGRSFKISDNFDTSHRTNLDGLFSYYLGESIPEIDTSNVTSMKDMFLHAKIKKLPNNFNTSKVTNMSSIFAGSNITSLPSNFDTSHVTNMEGMYAYSAFTSLPSDFDTSHVTNMERMFLHSKITKLPTHFDTSKVTDMSSMFEGSKMTSLPNDFDTSNVTDMGFMFQKSDIKKLPENFDTSNVTNMYAMFAGSKITTLPENFDTSNVTNMGRMFATEGGGFTGYSTQYCQIKKLPRNFYTSKVTSMKGMFYRNEKITSLPNSFDTSSVTNMESMFEKSAIHSLPWFDTSNVTIMSKMFYKSKNFNQDISDWDVENVEVVNWYGYTYEKWYWFNKDSALSNSNIPERFR